MEADPEFSKESKIYVVFSSPECASEYLKKSNYALKKNSADFEFQLLASLGHLFASDPELALSILFKILKAFYMSKLFENVTSSIVAIIDKSLKNSNLNPSEFKYFLPEYNYWRSIHPKSLKNFTQKFKVQIDPIDLLDFAGELWVNKYIEDAIFVAKIFNFSAQLQERFFIIQALCKTKKYDLISEFTKDNVDLAKIAVAYLPLSELKTITFIISKNSLDPREYPDILEKANEASLSYHVYRDDLCIYQLIEILYKDADGISLLTELLCRQKKSRWSLEIASFLISKFDSIRISDATHRLLRNVPPRICGGLPRDFEPLDLLSELSLELRRDQVLFIGVPEQLSTIRWQGQFAGIDSEWRSNILRFDDNKVSILQIAFEEVVYIFDMINLSGVNEFDSMIADLFQGDIIKLGVSFEGDMEALKKHYPHMKCFQKDMKNYIDIVKVYSQIYKKSPGGLAGACEMVMGKKLSKFEQRSNWENRPLRDSQLHYAALDAHVQLLIWRRLESEFRLNPKDFKKCKNSSYPSNKSCDNCSSRLHVKSNCPYGPRCKICYRHGHSAQKCTY